MKQALPFQLSKDRSFFESLGDWMGDVLYDELPEKGFECRDEQIYMAYQIEKALKDKKVLFAEAGVGTGKTIAYLLPAISYARYTGKPALIACADETLIEQLVKEAGDIFKLQQYLDIKIDVRLAKSRNQYLCLKRFEEAQKDDQNDFFIEVIEDVIPDFVYGHSSLQKVFPFGERSQFPGISDQDWQKVNFHPTQQCNTCDLRNRCGQTIHRQHYRESTDLIICSHDFLMEHIWTKESRIREGQLPFLPEVSMIVLDEGHLLEYAAQKALTYEIQSETLIRLLEKVMVDGVREKTLGLMERLQEVHERIFDVLRIGTFQAETERMKINKTEELMNLCKLAIKITDDLLEEFVFESELYTIPEYELRMVEEFLEQYSFSLRLFTEKGDGVEWLEIIDGYETLIIMPRLVTDILNEKLFTNKLPIIFSSATLSIQKDFSYLADSLGVENYQSFSVPSPFDYEEVMKIYSHKVAQDDKAKTVEKILQDQQQTLILFKSKAAMEKFRGAISQTEGIGFEGDRELSTIVKEFQEGRLTTLCSYHLWEGLDLPKQALTRVIIFDLPFPPSDPLFDAKRSFSNNPYEEVDLPYMLLRIQQGVGRLIRTSEDFGEIHLLLNEEEAALMPRFETVLPTRIKNM